mmetsp:Transcript_70926/g.184933  ORF Transcript_70926/g.184933 Transcript_70926/m.184933 type:complete len:214 (+) Transcript_70926:333-974(+)
MGFLSERRGKHRGSARRRRGSAAAHAGGEQVPQQGHAGFQRLLGVAADAGEGLGPRLPAARELAAQHQGRGRQLGGPLSDRAVVLQRTLEEMPLQVGPEVVAERLAALAGLCAGHLKVDEEVRRRGARDLEAEGHQYGGLALYDLLSCVCVRGVVCEVLHLWRVHLFELRCREQGGHAYQLQVLHHHLHAAQIAVHQVHRQPEGLSAHPQHHA